jgi:long-chain fatty acid transport protein
MISRKSSLLTSLIAMTLYSPISSSAGFGLLEQSVNGLGRAFAGGAAVADDASTIYYNPAGLTYLEHAELDMGINFLAPKIEFDDKGSTNAFGDPLTGGDDGDVANNAFLPNVYYSTPLNDRTHVGIGITAPFGLVTEYDDTWKGRYHAVKSDVRTININPSFAFKATDTLSIGFGVNLQKIDVELTQMADFAASYAASLSAPLSAIRAASQTGDAKATLRTDDWSWGYNLGVIWQATEQTRLGLSYRSKVEHKTKGYGRLNLVSTGQLLADGNISGSITLPESAAFAINHQVNAKLTLLAETAWTRWSRFQELTILSDGTLPSSSKPENWNDSMRYSLGVNYQYDEKWTFRTGVTFDESPIPDEYRTVRLPGEDRTWLSVGASYKYSDNMTVDAGYMHVFVRTAHVNEVDDNGYTLNGKYNVSSNILGLQMRWLFL